MINPAKLDVRRFGRFIVSGVASTVFYFGAATVLYWIWPDHPISSSLLAYVLCIGLSFLLQRNFTFRSEGKLSNESPKFVATSIAGLVLSTLVVRMGMMMGLHPIVTYLLVAIIVAPLSYVLLSLVVFTSNRHTYP